MDRAEEILIDGQARRLKYEQPVLNGHLAAR